MTAYGATWCAVVLIDRWPIRLDMPDRRVHDRRVRARVDLALVADPARGRDVGDAHVKPRAAASDRNPPAKPRPPVKKPPRFRDGVANSPTRTRT